MIRVTVASDATPFELVIARRVRSAARDGREGSLLPLDTVVEVVSRSDSQRAIIEFRGGEVGVGREESTDVQHRLTCNDIAMDSFQATESSALSEAVISALLPPTINWQDAAAVFWARAGGRNGFPERLRVLCLDDQAELELGDTGEPDCEIQGSSEALTSIFDGRSLFLEAMYNRQVFIRGSLRHLSLLQGVGLEVMLDA